MTVLTVSRSRFYFRGGFGRIFCSFEPFGSCVVIRVYIGIFTLFCIYRSHEVFVSYLLPFPFPSSSLPYTSLFFLLLLLTSATCLLLGLVSSG